MVSDSGFYWRKPVGTCCTAYLNKKNHNFCQNYRGPEKPVKKKKIWGYIF